MREKQMDFGVLSILLQFGLFFIKNCVYFLTEAFGQQIHPLLSVFNTLSHQVFRRVEKKIAFKR